MEALDNKDVETISGGMIMINTMRYLGGYAAGKALDYAPQVIMHGLNNGNFPDRYSGGWHG